jgi:hypothetical protein
MDASAVARLIDRWREDTGGTYLRWFLWEERVKNFRSIRRGIQAVVQEIEAGKFGNAYKGSSLETVVGSIAEQRQIFKGTTEVVAAFEVEHSTSIYSGIVRMLDLALGVSSSAMVKLFLVAPDAREADVRAQLARPAFSRIGTLDVSFLPYSALHANRDAMMRFGSGLRPLEAVAARLT